MVIKLTLLLLELNFRTSSARYNTGSRIIKLSKDAVFSANVQDRHGKAQTIEHGPLHTERFVFEFFWHTCL